MPQETSAAAYARDWFVAYIGLITAPLTLLGLYIYWITWMYAHFDTPELNEYIRQVLLLVGG
jgi:hypothetical protein